MPQSLFSLKDPEGNILGHINMIRADDPPAYLHLRKDNMNVLIRRVKQDPGFFYQIVDPTTVETIHPNEVEFSALS